MTDWGGDGWGAMVATLVLGQTLHYFAGHMTKFQELAQLMLRREVLWISVGSHQEQQFDAAIKGVRKLGFLGVAPYTRHSPPTHLDLLPCALGYYPHQTRPLWKRILFPLATQFIFPTTCEGYATHHGGKHSYITLYMSAAKAQLVFDVGNDKLNSSEAAIQWQHCTAGEQWRARVGIQIMIVVGMPLGFLALLRGVGASDVFVETIASTGVAVWFALVVWEACDAPYDQIAPAHSPPCDAPLRSDVLDAQGFRQPRDSSRAVVNLQLGEASTALLQVPSHPDDRAPSCDIAGSGVLDESHARPTQLVYAGGYHQACSFGTPKKCRSFRLTGDLGTWQPEMVARALADDVSRGVSFSACLPGCNPTDICSQHRNAQLDLPFLLVVDLVAWVNGQPAQRGSQSLAVPGASHGTLPNFHNVNTLAMTLSSDTQYLAGVHLVIIEHLKSTDPVQAWGWDAEKIQDYTNAVTHLHNSLWFIDHSNCEPHARVRTVPP